MKNNKGSEPCYSSRRFTEKMERKLWLLVLARFLLLLTVVANHC